MRKRQFLLILSIILLMNSAIIYNSYSKKENFNQVSKFKLRLSFESSLEYKHYAAVHGNAGEGDRFEWEFSGTNNYVGIIVMAMTESEFSKFQNGGTYYYYPLSNGSYYIDSGTFQPQSYDDWYIVFYNNDPDVQITYLTYEVNLVLDNAHGNGGDDSLFDSIFFPIIIGVIVVVIIGIVIGVIQQSKKKKEPRGALFKPPQIPVEPIQKPIESTMPSDFNQYEKNVKYCPQCGVQQKLNVVYCSECGFKID